jgi:hypothetical protein
MRTDLTAAFVSAKNATFRSPRQLLVFKFPTAGNVYVSDQQLGSPHGLANYYQPLVESWGELQDTAGDATAGDSGEIRQMSITLWNGGAHPFSDYFLAEFPENVEVELYQWFNGLAEADKALIDRFVVADPIEFDEASRLLQLDLVSLPIRYDQPCGDLLTREAWPYAADGDIGRGIPVACGSPGRIPAMKAKTVQQLRLKGSILSGTMVLPVYEDLDELQFATSGTVLIDEEKIRYSGRTASSLTVIQRGYLSTAAEHLDKREIVSVINDHTFVLCAGPVASIAAVQIDGFPAPVGTYTVRADLDPARIIFSEKPWVKKFAEATRFLEIQFDGVSGSNTALQPAYAYDAADLATAACIKPGNAVLALMQYTANRNRGEILKAYLAVEHWESGNFLSDYAEVWVSGVGVVGRLSRPNAADQIVLDADVDIDHPHSHEIGGEHIHNFTQPTVPTVNPDHGHTSSVTGTTVDDGSKTGFPAEYAIYTGSRSIEFSYGSHLIADILSQKVHIKFRQMGTGPVSLCTAYNGYGALVTWDSTDKYADQWVNIPYPYVARLYIYLEGAGVVGGYIRVDELTLSTTKRGSITVAKTAVTASAINGAVKDTGVVNVKNADDVSSLATANRGVNINTQENPSRTVVNLFDLTNHVKFNWDWFTGREVRVTYFNVGDAKAVYILHAFFDVEYVPTEVVYSDAVTAEVTSLADYIRPDLAVKKLLTSKAGVAATDFDTTSFNTIATKFSTLGYRLDGMIGAEATVREAVNRICRQSHSRFFSSGGKLKMALREGHPASKPAVRLLDTTDVQLRSIKAARQPLRDIANRVQLFYKRDWTADDSSTAGFLASVTRENATSIGRFGLKTSADGYTFDLIRDAAMAAKVADFYLSVDSWPSTFYTFLAYLEQFDLEKEDVIQVSANFNQMNKVPMVLRAMDRRFGSGKNGSINLLRIVAENLYYLLTKMNRADAVLVSDAMTFVVTEIGHFDDLAHVIDELLLRLNMSHADAVAVADLLQLLMDYRPIVADAVTTAVAMYADLSGQQADTVVLADTSPEVWAVYGFGSGSFGEVMFGGLSAWRQKSPDQISIFERLLVAISTALDAAAEVDEELLIGSGFGGHLSSGFGASPFGG